MCEHHYKDDSYLKVPLEKADKREFYRELHKIADKAEPTVRRQILEMFDKISDEASLRKVEQAVKENNLDKVLIELGITQAGLQRSLKPTVDTLRRVFEDAADAVLDNTMPKKVQVGMRFDALNPRSVEYIRNQGAALVTNVTETTRRGIQEIMRESFEIGITPRQTAERIKERVGLLPKHAKAVTNYRALLVSEGVKPAVVTKRVEAYRKRLLRYRARMISRTETMFAANNGNLALFNQAAENGLIDLNKTRKKFIVTPDDRLCKICRPIPQENTEVGVNEPFQTSVGPKMVPPIHPGCRCAISLSFGK